MNRSIVLNLTHPESPYCMVTNVMSGKKGPMTLSAETSHLGSVTALQELFRSDHLYTDSKVHALWVGLFASGTIYGCKRAAPKDKLDSMVDIDYEAHARYEMISRLSCQGWRHGYTPAILAQRAQEFRQIRKLVRVDRLQNLAKAEANRLQLSQQDDNDASQIQALGSGGLADTTDEDDDI